MVSSIYICVLTWIYACLYCVFNVCAWCMWWCGVRIHFLLCIHRKHDPWCCMGTYTIANPWILGSHKNKVASPTSRVIKGKSSPSACLPCSFWCIPRHGWLSGLWEHTTGSSWCSHQPTPPTPFPYGCFQFILCPPVFVLGVTPNQVQNLGELHEVGADPNKALAFIMPFFAIVTSISEILFC